jgi:hypothetical protein
MAENSTELSFGACKHGWLTRRKRKKNMLGARVDLATHRRRNRTLLRTCEDVPGIYFYEDLSVVLSFIG